MRGAGRDREVFRLAWTTALSPLIGTLVLMGLAAGLAFDEGLQPESLNRVVIGVVLALALMLALLGMIGGIWAEKFDHIAAVTNFVITPFSFLSGTFYSIERLPETWQVVAHFNPFFYMIDGFRYGFIGHADGNLLLGLAVMAVFNLFLCAVTYRMFATGYRLKP